MKRITHQTYNMAGKADTDAYNAAAETIDAARAAADVEAAAIIAEAQAGTGTAADLVPRKAAVEASLLDADIQEIAALAMLETIESQDTAHRTEQGLPNIPPQYYGQTEIARLAVLKAKLARDLE